MDEREIDLHPAEWKSEDKKWPKERAIRWENLLILIVAAILLYFLAVGVRQTIAPTKPKADYTYDLATGNLSPARKIGDSPYAEGTLLKGPGGRIFRVQGGIPVAVDGAP